MDSFVIFLLVIVVIIIGGLFCFLKYQRNRYAEQAQRSVETRHEIAKQTMQIKHELEMKQLEAESWREAYTTDGKLYYQNDVTEQTQWERPN